MTTLALIMKKQQKRAIRFDNQGVELCSREVLQTKLEEQKNIKADDGIFEQHEKRKRGVSGPQAHSHFSFPCCLYSQIEQLMKAIAERITDR